MEKKVNKTFGKFASSREVKFERLLPGPIETVWEYLTDSEKRGLWLASGPMEAKVGGKLTLNFLHSDLSEEKKYPERFKGMENGATGESTITAYDPPRFLSFTWSPDSEVSFELIPKGEDVLLILKHYKLTDEGEGIMVSSGWHTHLDILIAKLSQEPVPLFWQTFLEYETAYEELRKKVLS